MARRTKQEAEQTRQALLDTALRLFSERGIGQTSLKDVAAETGVTHGALYWHFKNREDLVQALYERSRLPLDELQLEQMQAARQDGIKALGDFLLQWCEMLLDNSQHGQIWQVFHRGSAQTPELVALSEAIEQEHAEWRDRISLFVKNARKQKQIKLKVKDPAELDSAAANLMVLVFGLIDSQLTAPTLVTPENTFKPVIRTYLKGMQS